MKSIIIFLALIFTVNISAQIDLQNNISSAFYVSESYKSTKQLSDEVATDILSKVFGLSKVKESYLTVDSFVLTNERDNIYTGNLVMHDDGGLATIPVEVVYDGSSVRWTIPPSQEWSLTLKNKIPTETKQKAKSVSDIKAEADSKDKQKQEEKKRKLDALLGGVSKSEGTATRGEGNNNKAGDKGQLDGDPYAASYFGTGGLGSGGVGYGLKGRGKATYQTFKQDCKESGLVIVRIMVNNNGNVIDAEPGVKGTTNTALCLLESAKKIALSHKWSPDSNAPTKQIGFVSVNFELSN